jgi:hypothetical protein
MPDLSSSCSSLTLGWENEYLARDSHWSSSCGSACYLVSLEIDKELKGDVMKIILVMVLCAAISGILYRMGGAAGYDTKWRDCGVSFVFCLQPVLLGMVHGLLQWVSLLPTFGLMWGALTTYHYFLPKPLYYRWWHYAMHGFFVSLAAILYAYASGHWVLFGIRVVFCTVAIGLWSLLRLKDVPNEVGRGVIIGL